MVERSGGALFGYCPFSSTLQGKCEDARGGCGHTLHRWHTSANVSTNLRPRSEDIQSLIVGRQSRSAVQFAMWPKSRSADSMAGSRLMQICVNFHRLVKQFRIDRKVRRHCAMIHTFIHAGRMIPPFDIHPAPRVRAPGVAPARTAWHPHPSGCSEAVAGGGSRGRSDPGLRIPFFGRPP